jgi:dihydrolipoamide dehydrogenase
MPNESFDIVVIGGGPGGYVAAIRAAQLGLKTALVEKRQTLGGTCLNVGCIPSKALLHSSEMFAFAHGHAAAHGVKLEKVSLDLPTMMKRKASVVDGLVKGVGQLVQARKITRLEGTGRLKTQGTVVVATAAGEQEISGQHIIIATGSVPVQLPFMPFDGQTVVSSDEAIAFDQVPEKLVVVGAGAIGLELGSVWARLGSDVTVVEFLPRIAAGYDEDVTRAAERAFKKQGLKFETGAKVTGLKPAQGKAKAVLTAERDGKVIEIEADKVLVAVGRAPFTQNLGLEAAGVALDERKRIKTDAHFKTSAPGIYAIGDVIAGPMLAHKAEEEGVAVVELIAGKAGHVNYEVIPNVIYTDPEIAGVGLTETIAKERKLDYRVGKFPLAANGRALANDATDGFVKVIADAKTDRLLGVQIVGRGASELIAEAVAHMEYGGSAEDLGRTVHAHPTMSEALKEAGLAVSKSAIHAL